MKEFKITKGEKTYIIRANDSYEAVCKLKGIKDQKQVAKFVKRTPDGIAEGFIFETNRGFYFTSPQNPKDDKDFQSQQNAENHAKKLGYIKDSANQLKQLLNKSDVDSIDDLDDKYYIIHYKNGTTEKVMKDNAIQDTNIKYNAIVIEFIETMPGITEALQRVKGKRFAPNQLNELNKLLVEADAKIQAQKKSGEWEGGYLKVFFDNYLLVDGKEVKYHAGRVDLGDGPQYVKIQPEELTGMIDLYKLKYNIKDEGIQDVDANYPYTLTLRNSMNYTIYQYKIDPQAKTIKKGNFDMGSGKGTFFNNKKELERRIDELVKKGYTLKDSAIKDGYDEAKLEKWLKALEEQRKKEYPNTELNHYKYRANKGKKYIKIIQQSHDGHDESVFAFMDYDGNIYKAASWNAPASGVRATLDNPPLTLGAMYK